MKEVTLLGVAIVEELKGMIQLLGEGNKRESGDGGYT